MSEKISLDSSGDVVKDLLRFMFSLSHINYLNMPMMGH